MIKLYLVTIFIKPYNSRIIIENLTIDILLDFLLGISPGEKLIGEIDFVNPVLDQKSRTLKVRATIENASGKLKPGMIANAVLTISLAEIQ